MRLIDRLISWWFPPSKRVRVGFNYFGPLPQLMTWRWASNNVPITPFQDLFLFRTMKCPVCDAALAEQRCDPWRGDHEGGEQYSVIILSCPNGHGRCIEWM